MDKKSDTNDKGLAKGGSYEPLNRIIDIIFSIVFMIVFSPIYLITAIAIWLQDFHSPIYSHYRIGKYGKKFRIYKFRSMVIDADDILFKKDKKLYDQMRSGTNKVEEDPRITKIGRFIRKYSIDEFPQMVNVLKGEQSVVGPRALRPDEFDLYKSKDRENEERLKTLVTVKPGVTGYWQTHGRSDVDFDNRMDMDCYYATHKSFRFDLSIILMTPIAMLKAEGAY